MKLLDPATLHENRGTPFKGAWLQAERCSVRRRDGKQESQRENLPTLTAVCSLHSSSPLSELKSTIAVEGVEA